MATKKYIKDRAREPSSWAGISAALLGALQAYTSTGSKTAAVIGGLAALAGGAAVALPDKKAEPPTPQ